MQENKATLGIEPLTKRHARLLIFLGVPFLLISPWIITGIFSLIMDFIDGRIKVGELAGSTQEADLFRRVIFALFLFLGGAWVWFDYRAIVRGTCSVEATKRIWIRSIIVNSLWFLFFAGLMQMIPDGDRLLFFLFALMPVFFIVVSIRALMHIQRRAGVH